LWTPDQNCPTQRYAGHLAPPRPHAGRSRLGGRAGVVCRGLRKGSYGGRGDQRQELLVGLPDADSMVGIGWVDDGMECLGERLCVGIVASEEEEGRGRHLRCDDAACHPASPCTRGCCILPRTPTTRSALPGGQVVSGGSARQSRGHADVVDEDAARIDASLGRWRVGLNPPVVEEMADLHMPQQHCGVRDETAVTAPPHRL